VEKAERKRPLERPKYRWEDNIKMDLKEICWDAIDWINWSQYIDQWWAVVRW
jgi:hypothetical protein